MTTTTTKQKLTFEQFLEHDFEEEGRYEQSTPYRGTDRIVSRIPELILTVEQVLGA